MIEIPQDMPHTRTLRYRAIQRLVQEYGLTKSLVMLDEGSAPITKVQDARFDIDLAVAQGCDMTLDEYLQSPSVVYWLDTHALGSTVCDE